MRLHASTAGVPAESTPETLHESATTRVRRERLGGASVVCKQPLGAGAAQRLEREADMLARLADVPGVVQLAAGTFPPGVLGLQDCAGWPLAQMLRDGPLEPAPLLALAVQLARTLSAVHRRGLIHRDISPANVIVSPTGEVVLIDFDLAVPADAKPAADGSEGLVGTLAYVAPEQTGRTGRAVDQRADLYSLGATFYEMATGRPPFQAGEALQLIHDHLGHEPVAPRERNARLPEMLSRIILRLLAKAPDQRYQSAEGLLHDLGRVLDEDTASAALNDSDRMFPLGERDFALRLAAPQRLVGRDTELGLLRGALAAATETPRHTVLVEGAPGVGKSALIGELKPLVAAAGGWFVYGKFDQFQRDAAAAGALAQALRALGRLLLAETRDALAAHRQRIIDRVGRHAPLLTRQLPEFALLLGEPPADDDAAVDPGQGEQRVLQATVALLAAIASTERPLVVVLDDLQWADVQSLRTFERLMNETALRGLLLVGAYRGKEINPAHALSPMLLQWKEKPEVLLHLELPNLSPAGMCELVGEMLRLPPDDADALAQAVHVLTAGNPFDTVEIVNTLRQEGALSLRAQGWEWDTSHIRRFAGQSSVVDLLAARIAHLPRPSRLLVEYMSCLGGSVDHEVLRVAGGVRPEVLREQLRAPLDEGLLAADPNGLAIAHFRHDRVQQAVLGGLDDTRRARRQLDMARRLAQHASLHTYAAQQYLGCVEALVEPQEMRTAARLFHGTALDLMKRANAAQAERYLACAVGLVVRTASDADDAFAAQVEAARHAALYALGRLDDADASYARVSAGLDDPLDLVEPTCVQMRSVYIRGRMREALDLGLALLARLGVDVPAGFVDPTMEQRLDALSSWVSHECGIDPAHRPPIRDRHLLGVAKVLSRLVPPASFLVDIDALVWLTLESQRLWAEHGPCAALVVALSRANRILILTRQDYRTGFEIVRHVLAVGAAHGFEAETLEGRHVFTISASHWFEPLEETHRQAVRVREGLSQLGDTSYVCFTYFVTSEALFEFSPTLDSCATDVATGTALSRRTGNNLNAILVLFAQQLVRALRGETQGPGSFTDAEFDEDAFMSGGTSPPPVARITYHVRRALAAALFDDLPQLAEHSNAAMGMLSSTPGFHLVALAHFMRALALAWQLQVAGATLAPAERTVLLDELRRCRVWLAARASEQPYNFQHLLRLVEAEEAWAGGDVLRAMTLFDLAMGEAGERNRPWHRALIAERWGRFQLAQQWTHAGRTAMTLARDLYDAWGATAKVRHMEQAHAFLQPANGASALHAAVPVPTDALDLMGVLSASQALSSETNLEQLAGRVTEVLAALSGATKVLVLLSDDEQGWLLATAPGTSPIPLARAAARGLVPMSAVHYAERTHEALLVDDASSDDRFARDSYFDGVPFCSLLVVPIAGQGTARAMLVLENRLGRAAFNAQRLDAVKLIAGQLAVSLANAQLYGSLERRVQARTHELQHTQAELVATARRAGKAEIANNVLHNVGNVLNSINVSASVVRGVISGSRAESLARVVALLKDHEHDLAGFIAHDPRGKALPVYLNELVGVLRKERQDALDDLDRLVRSVDHISYVVATQQSHAGPSSVLQLAQPEELLEEALRLSGEAIARWDVTVLRRYERVPAALLDKPRMLQVLTNLIGNGAQAMAAAASRELTLETEVVRDDAGQRLRILVRDEGEGIAPENLTRIFAHGFTTRADGHGFGLHSSVLAAMEMGGTLGVHSDGAGRGAVFTFEVPLPEKLTQT